MDAFGQVPRDCLAVPLGSLRPGVLVLSFLAAFLSSAIAQETPPVARPSSPELVSVPVDARFGRDELDRMVAKVALYPDSLLAQVLVAVTYPLDLVKADRWFAQNQSLSAKDRAKAAEAEPWDPSVQILAGGFPTVVTGLAEDIDTTEALGEAVLTQTDDVLDAIQRMRSRAMSVGTLTTSEAQTVVTDNEKITIKPTDPGAVYVPTYDPVTVYAPATATTGNLLATGAIAFGSALLLNEIFDDNDDDYWRGPPPIDWDDNNFYPRGGVNIDGDVNIDRDRTRVRVGDRDQIDLAADRPVAWKADPERARAARENISYRSKGNGTRTRDTLNARSVADAGDARARLEAANKRRPAEKSLELDSALRPREGGASAASLASKRGNASINRIEPGGIDRARVKTDYPKTVSRAQSVKPAKKVSPERATAFKKTAGGARTQQATARGKKSAGGHKAIAKRR